VTPNPKSPELHDETVRRLVERVVEEVHPLRVVLFGSQAQGETHAHSDVDLLVVMPDGTPRRRVAQRLYTNIRGMGIPVDYLVATPSVLHRHRNNPGLIYREALRTGREVYAAA